jgi:hypothetical protein
MPIYRYFVFVGGALLVLLFALDFALPKAPAAQTALTASGEAPLIRIRSDRKLPERVVLDTSQPTVASPAVQMAAGVAPQPPVRAESSSALNDLSAKARVRETFAQVVPTAATVKKPQPKRKIARTRPYYYAPPGYYVPGQPTMRVAQQPHFGLFNMTW